MFSFALFKKGQAFQKILNPRTAGHQHAKTDCISTSLYNRNAYIYTCTYKIHIHTSGVYMYILFWNKGIRAIVPTFPDIGIVKDFFLAWFDSRLSVDMLMRV